MHQSGPASIRSHASIQIKQQIRIRPNGPNGSGARLGSVAPGPNDPVALNARTEVDEEAKLQIRGSQVVAHLFLRKIGNTLEGLHLYNDSLFNQQVQAMVSNLNTSEAHRYRNLALHSQAPQPEHNRQRPHIDRLSVAIPKFIVNFK